MINRLVRVIEFNRAFVHYMWQIREVLVLLLLLIVLGGCVIAKLENIEIGDGIYFSLITGLTIGYGDIVPKTGLGRVISVAIGLIGVLFVGLIVAVATQALRDTAERFKKKKSHPQQP